MSCGHYSNAEYAALKSKCSVGIDTNPRYNERYPRMDNHPYRGSEMHYSSKQLQKDKKYHMSPIRNRAPPADHRDSEDEEEEEEEEEATEDGTLWRCHEDGCVQLRNSQRKLESDKRRQAADLNSSPRYVHDMLEDEAPHHDYEHDPNMPHHSKKQFDLQKKYHQTPIKASPQRGHHTSGYSTPSGLSSPACSRVGSGGAWHATTSESHRMFVEARKRHIVGITNHHNTITL